MPRTRLLLGIYLCFVLLLALSGGLLHHHGPGWTAESVLAYYRGAGISADDGAAFGMVDAAAPPARLAIGKTWGSLLETAHIHLAFMPLTILVVAHIAAMTAVGRRAWAGIAAIACYAAAAGDIGLPFAVRYAPDWLAWPAAALKPIAFAILALGLVGMAIIALAACIRPAPAADRAPG